MRILQVCLSVSTQNQPSLCKLSAFPDAVLTASFICSLIMRKEGLGKEEDGCLKYKCSPQAAIVTGPKLSVLEAALYAQNREAKEDC